MRTYDVGLRGYCLGFKALELGLKVWVHYVVNWGSSLPTTPHEPLVSVWFSIFFSPLFSTFRVISLKPCMPDKSISFLKREGA